MSKNTGVVDSISKRLSFSYGFYTIVFLPKLNHFLLRSLPFNTVVKPLVNPFKVFTSIEIDVYLENLCYNSFFSQRFLFVILQIWHKILYVLLYYIII